MVGPCGVSLSLSILELEGRSDMVVPSMCGNLFQIKMKPGFSGWNINLVWLMDVTRAIVSYQVV